MLSLSLDRAKRVWGAVPAADRQCQHCYAAASDASPGMVVDALADKSIGAFVCSPKCGTALQTAYRADFARERDGDRLRATMHRTHPDDDVPELEDNPEFQRTEGVLKDARDIVVETGRSVWATAKDTSERAAETARNAVSVANARGFVNHSAMPLTTVARVHTGNGAVFTAMINTALGSELARSTMALSWFLVVPAEQIPQAVLDDPAKAERVVQHLAYKKPFPGSRFLFAFDAKNVYPSVGGTSITVAVDGARRTVTYTLPSTVDGRGERTHKIRNLFIASNGILIEADSSA